MADIVIDDALETDQPGRTNPRSLVWVSKTVGYAFFVDNFTDLAYRKTTDSGASWGARVEIRGGQIEKFAIWYDKWTSGDAGDVIHIVFADAETDDNITYNSFSVSDDTLDGEVTVLNGTSVDEQINWSVNCLSITKSRNGIIFVGGWIDNDGENGFWKGTNDPATSFASKTTLADGNEVDRIMLLAGSEADPDDIWCIYQDVSTNEITLKVYDDSGNTWGESAAIDTMVEAVDLEFFGFDCMDRHSDGHAILVLWNEDISATGDLAVWDITNITTFTAKTDVISDSAVYGMCGLLLDQNNDNLYVGYSTGTTSGQIVYKKSEDGGGAWGNETAMSVTGDNHKIIMGGGSIANSGEGRWMPVWLNDDFKDLMVNADNSIELPEGAAPSATGKMFAMFT